MYNAKVQTVKDEHSQLLQEAFERAKVSPCWCRDFCILNDVEQGR